MRITDNMRFAAAVIHQTRSAERLDSATRRAASGLRAEQPSDDPVVWARGAARQGTLSVLSARRASIERAQGDLELAESMLASAGDIMVRAKELAVQMANGDLGPSERANAAKEVTALRQALVGVANTQGSRGYLFGGTRTDAPPFAASGAFAGNDLVMPVEIAEGVTLAGNPSGAKAFTAAGGQDVFKVLDDLAAALGSDDLNGITAAIDATEAGHRQLVSARVSTGVGVTRLRDAAEIAGVAIDRLSAAQQRDLTVDPATAYTELTQARAAYERSLAVTRTILSLSEDRF